MSGFKGTKGKWVELKHAKGNISSLDGRMVANCMGYSTNSDNGEHIDESQANALLISKAPEMLEMLEELNDYLSSLEITNEKLNNLIKEATELWPQSQLQSVSIVPCPATQSGT